MPSDSLQIINALGSVATACALIVACFQLRTNNQQLKADHERSRRENAVQLLNQWNSSLDRAGSSARKIIDPLTEEQCRQIFNNEEVTISHKCHDLLVAALTTYNEQSHSSKPVEDITLTAPQSSELRWLLVKYLNSLEFTLVAWQNSTVDRGIIEEQFSFLFNPANGHELLKNFRKAAGGENTYPAIEIFAAYLSEKRKEKLKRKMNVV